MARGEGQGLWLYAVADRLAGQDAGGLYRELLRGLAGVGRGPVRVAEAAGLTAVVEGVDLAEFGEAALRRNLEDPAWLEATARAHHRVIDAASGLGSLLPARLATVYSGEATMAAAFARRREDFRAALGRVRARREWGVKAYVALPSEPGRAAASGPAGAARSGAAYLRRRRDQLSARRDLHRDAAAGAKAIHSRLSRHAAETRLHPPQSPQLTGQRAQMLLNAAYLLDGDREDDFASTVATLSTQHPSVRLELTGPWPPYSFTAAEVGGR